MPSDSDSHARRTGGTTAPSLASGIAIPVFQRLFAIAGLGLGAALATLHGADLISPGAPWRYFKGTAWPTPGNPTGWVGAGYGDAGWAAGGLPIGYDAEAQWSFTTSLPDMRNSYTTVLLRHTFPVASPAGVSNAQLTALCDDGFVIWLNGVELARNNTPAGTLSQTSTAPTAGPEPLVPRVFAVPAGRLVAGDNVLAVLVLNAGAGSSDLFFDVQLTGSLVESVPPTITAVTPPPGEVGELTEITVTFSEAVNGLDAGDLLVNGQAAAGVTGGGNRHTFQFAQPVYGGVTITWADFHGIADQAVTPNPFNQLAAGHTWSYTLVDPTVPQLSAQLPLPGDTVRQLSQVALTFTEPVIGLEAADLLVDGQPAQNVTGIAAGPYVFTFPARGLGAAQFTWADAHGVTDLSGQPFTGQPWSVTVNPDAGSPDVQLNEFLAVNTRGLLDEDGEASAWLELVNPGPAPVDLTGYALTDDLDVPDQWVFPNLTLAPGAHLVIFASGKDRRDPTGGRRLHASFKLSRAGEPLVLFNREFPRQVVTGFTNDYPEQRNDLSFGRDATGQWRYLTTPTPGAANQSGSVAGACEPVHFSVERGFFLPGTSFDLILTTPTPDAVIRYTTNGLDPSPASPIYTAPILVNRTLPVRAAAFKNGLLPSVTRTHTYLFPPSAGQRQMRAISLVTATNNLTGPTGIVGMQGGSRNGDEWVRVSASDYYNPINRGIAWERPVSVELIDPSDNGGFQEDAGLRLQASDYFRPRLFPSSKFSWRVYFRGDYGAGKLRFPLLPQSPVEEFDVLVLRGGSNDRNPMVKDELARQLFADCGQVSAQGTFTTVWLNGRLMPEGGYYNPTERIESDFMQTHFGGSDQWDVMSQSGAVDGTRSNFDQLVNYAANRNLANRPDYEVVARWLDLPNFIDYLLVNIYAHTGDWPHNNWRAARERRADAPWRFFIWDAEFGFGTYDRPVTGNTITGELGNTGSPIPQLYHRLRANPEFLLLFADRIQRHFFNDGGLTDARIRQRFEEFYTAMRPVLSGDRFIANTWIPQRRRYIFAHFNAAGLLAGSNAPAFRQHGGAVPAGFALTMTNNAGEIWFTTDGADPRVPFTGAVSPAARRFDPSAPPLLAASVTVKARSRNGASWSALSEAVFQVAQLGVPLRITEIMFNPPGGEAYEFLEIQNPSASALDLGGVSLRGVTFQFPNGTIMPANAVWVLASDVNPALFNQRYPGVPVAGWFDGSLANGGERLALVDARGETIQSVDYDDEAGWPGTPDGDGPSLTLVRPELDPDDPAAWEASAQAGGTPGVHNPTPPAFSAVRISEVLTLNAGSVVHGGAHPDFVELVNASESSVSLAGWSLLRADRTNQFAFPAGTSLAAGARLVVWCDTETVAGEFHSGFALPREGGTLLLHRPDGSRADLLSWGAQVADHSVSRLADDEFVLSLPTPLAANVAAETAAVTSLAINEWLANSRPDQDDFIELFNRDTNAPAALRGLWLGASNALFQIRALAFVPPGGQVVFQADENPGPDHVDFKLPAAGAALLLLDAAGSQLDRVTYVGSAEGVSVGRLPDGEPGLVGFPLTPSPGASNYLPPDLGVRLNEILARSATGDWVELENTNPAAVSLSGWSLRVRAPEELTWTFPANATLAASGFLTLGGVSGGQAVQWPGFALPDTGAVIELLSPDGRIADTVTYGAQIAGQSIGRTGGAWSLLSQPTPGALNSFVAILGSQTALKLNEWRAGATNEADWVELFNPAAQPVALGELRLTDDPSLAGVNKHVLPPAGFLAAGDWLLLNAAGTPESGFAHLGFQLSQLGESLRLYGTITNLLDAVTIHAGLGTASAGRLPDGGTLITPLSPPTPGAANQLNLDTDGDGLPDAWETQSGLDPLSADDAALDADSDGFDNRREFLAGTDPRDPQSAFRLAVTLQPDGSVRLRFIAQPGRSYSVLAGDSLEDVGGIRLRHVLPSATATEIEVVDQPAQPRLYQVVTPALPE